MKTIFFPFFLILQIPCISQSNSPNCFIHGIIGIMLHDNGEPEFSPGGPPKILTTSVFGIEVGKRDFPMRISLQRGYNLTFFNYLGKQFDEEWNVDEILEEDQVNFYWGLKYFSIGLGHYWKRRENALKHMIPGFFVEQRKGVQISISYPAQWLDIELRAKLQYAPNFAGIVGGSNYSLLFIYRIGAKKEEFNNMGFLTLNGVIGARAFPINIKLIPGEKFNKPFGVAPGLGVEFLVNNLNLSLNLEKDWWLSFNGGSPSRDIKGLIYSTFVGVKYHHLLKTGRHLRFGFGGSWIEDNENKFENITPNPSPEVLKLGYYQVKGFGISVSYEVLPNTDIELKTTLPLLGEDIFENSSRTSIGLFYRYNPFRKKGG
ncbi:MAG: hypothetical protein IPH04_08510 [Saprospirales bacterium]|nr:hypothetical protein [Saprospirales bacterium]